MSPILLSSHLIASSGCFSLAIASASLIVRPRFNSSTTAVIMGYLTGSAIADDLGCAVEVCLYCVVHLSLSPNDRNQRGLEAIRWIFLLCRFNSNFVKCQGQTRLWVTFRVLEKGEALRCQPQALRYLPLRQNILFNLLPLTCPLSTAGSSVLIVAFSFGPIPSI